MTKRKPWKQLKQKEYTGIKAILDAGISVSKTIVITDRSWSTVVCIRDSKDLEDYRNLVKARSEKYRAVTVKPKEEPVQETNGMTELDTSAIADRIQEAIKREEQMVALLAEMNKNIALLAKTVYQFNTERKMGKKGHFKFL